MWFFMSRGAIAQHAEVAHCLLSQLTLWELLKYRKQSHETSFKLLVLSLVLAQGTSGIKHLHGSNPNIRDKLSS